MSDDTDNNGEQIVDSWNIDLLEYHIDNKYTRIEPLEDYVIGYFITIDQHGNFTLYTKMSKGSINLKYISASEYECATCVSKTTVLKTGELFAQIHYAKTDKFVQHTQEFKFLDEAGADSLINFFIKNVK